MTSIKPYDPNNSPTALGLPSSIALASGRKALGGTSVVRENNIPMHDVVDAGKRRIIRLAAKTAVGLAVAGAVAPPVAEQVGKKIDHGFEVQERFSRPPQGVQPEVLNPSQK